MIHYSLSLRYTSKEDSLYVWHSRATGLACIALTQSADSELTTDELMKKKTKHCSTDRGWNRTDKRKPTVSTAIATHVFDWEGVKRT